MDKSPAIHSKWIANQEAPRIQILDEALPHTQKQHAAAEHIKQRLAQSIDTPRTDDRDRVRAVKDEAQLRLMLALLQCPDAEVSPLVFAHESQHLYDPARHCPRDILKDNQFLCNKARELVELWMGPFEIDFETMKRREGYMFRRQVELSETQFPEIIVWQGYRCVFTHTTRPVETAHVIPEHITQLDTGSGCPGQLEAFTTLLSYVFPAKMVDERAIKDLLSGRGKPNTIPLDTSFHALWDQFRMILRPVPLDQGVEAGGDDGKTLKLQFLELGKEDPAFADTIYAVVDEMCIADCWRRPGLSPPIRICTGDIYELQAEDPVKRPLPSRMLLDITCRMHQLRHSFMAKDALHSLFRGPPPNVTDDVAVARYQEEPGWGFWEGVIKGAIEDRVLSEEDGWKWIVVMEQLDREDEGN
ncbi:hypothetical protein PG985_012943 [Apiospora marii]|uniref:HNH nuclease domain-containing protein n=1 Tax=Apiospora marii TaxID=335849 RepID=A0ABR1RC88_9PEZI